jgi:quercetin dioxygenase-like cupin family protein
MIEREQLLTAAVQRHVDRVEAYRVKLPPGQKAGRHHHVGGVVGLVEQGRIAYQRDGADPIEITAGDAFFEPAGTDVSRFDNLSDAEPATFVAYYLLTGDQPLITFD